MPALCKHLQCWSRIEESNHRCTAPLNALTGARAAPATATKRAATTAANGPKAPAAAAAASAAAAALTTQATWQAARAAPARGTAAPPARPLAAADAAAAASRRLRPLAAAAANEWRRCLDVEIVELLYFWYTDILHLGKFTSKLPLLSWPCSPHFAVTPAQPQSQCSAFLIARALPYGRIHTV